VKGGVPQLAEHQWLQRIDDVTVVEKSCVVKATKGKNVKEKCCIIAT